MILRPAIALLILLPLASCSSDPQWTDVEGRARSPLNAKSRPATVLLFIATECPISNGYAPELARIAARYSPQGIEFFAIHTDPAVTREIAVKHAQEFSLPFPVLLDPKQSLAHHVGATVTPEAAVIDRRGGVAYLGRINDVYASYGKRRQVATTHELTDALDAVLAGKNVAQPRVVPIGCEIPPPASH